LVGRKAGRSEGLPGTGGAAGLRGLEGRAGRDTRQTFEDRSARIVVTMGMPALLYRWHFRAHTLKAPKRNILGFAWVAPIRETLIGSVESMKQAQRLHWLGRLTRMRNAV
jgi:putative NADPH-quinone reductase